MHCVCHDCLAAKQSSKDGAGKRKAVKPHTGKRKASDTGSFGGGVMEERKVWNRTDNRKTG